MNRAILNLHLSNLLHYNVTLSLSLYVYVHAFMNDERQKEPSVRWRQEDEYSLDYNIKELMWITTFFVESPDLNGRIHDHLSDTWAYLSHVPEFCFQLNIDAKYKY